MILVAYGTRPEWIKIKPLIYEFKKNNIPYKTIFTGQHKDLVTNVADYNLNMVEISENRLDNIINNCTNLPDSLFIGITHVLVQGDTSSALGLALTAFNRKIKVIHLEAGLRTYNYDNPYPEEINRQLIGRISDINLCPTEYNLKNLINEKVMGESCVVGNTGLDNLLEYKENTTYDNIVLITLHRRENHDKIDKWFTEIDRLAWEHPNIKFILPIHPNPNVTKHKHILSNVKIIEPLTHKELLDLLVKCKLVITDSGGLQEECSFLNKKCLVCRQTTERPESIGVTTFMVEDIDKLNNMFNEHIYNYEVNTSSPFGDGFASKKIIEVLIKKLHV
jgi:UDP-N-acetylglucosamine 2-epimerase (non-hydrolysing)